MLCFNTIYQGSKRAALESSHLSVTTCRHLSFLKNSDPFYEGCRTYYNFNHFTSTT